MNAMSHSKPAYSALLRLWLRLSALVLVLVAAPSWAQTSAKILVLTTHEGTPTQAPYKDDGLWASNGLARAFGYTDAVDAVPTITPSAPGNVYLRSTPNVVYKYGALSIRAKKTSDVVIAGGTAGSKNLVRVTNSANPAAEEVVEMDDNTVFLDPNDLSLFKPANAERYDLVVVGSTYFKVVDEAYATLATLMKDPARKPGAILYFVDSCCDSAGSNSSNVARFNSEILKPATGLSTSLDSYNGNTAVGMLNNTTAAAEYTRSFKNDSSNSIVNLETLEGGYYQWLLGIPSINQLFRLDGATDGNVYGAFFPTKDIFKTEPNGGTCTFAVVDISPFDHHRFASNVQTSATQGTRNVGQAFIDAALGGGSCGGMASIAATPASQNLTLKPPATPNTMVLTITNKSLVAGTAISGGTVKASLPANLAFAGTPASTCTNGTSSTPLAVTVNGTAFEISGIGIPFGQNCSITLPVQWSDTSDPATNACIKAASNTSQLTITPGATTGNSFSTTQGQTNDLAQAAVVCSAPELLLEQSSFPTSALKAGDTVNYTVTVSNLSESAAVDSALLNNVLPAGVDPATATITAAASNPASCVSTGGCSLPAKDPANTTSPQASFVVSFVMPTGMGQLNLSANARLSANQASTQAEVTLANNDLALSAPVQKTVTVRAILNGGNGEFPAQALAYSLTGCTASPAPSPAALNFDSHTAGNDHTVSASETCSASFSTKPGPTPSAGGYTLASDTPTINTSTDPVTGNQVIEAVWTAAAPSTASVKGSIVHGASALPAGLAGQSLNYNVVCLPSAALPTASGVLMVDANGLLSSPDKQVAAGSSCSLQLSSSLTPPAGYRLEAPVQTQTGNNFVVSIKLVPTLSIAARIDTPAGSTADFSALLQPLAYTVTACQATPAAGAAVPKLNANGEVQTHSIAEGTQCEFDFAGGPNANLLPAGYTLASSTPTITRSKSAQAKAVASGPQSVVVTWTVLAPGAAAVSGSITGMPAGFAASLAGKTLGFALSCSPSAASPAAGTLTVDARGALSTSTSPTVAAGSTCTLGLSSDPSTLPLPAGYEWAAPVISNPSSNVFVLTLAMQAKATAGTPTPVPSLQNGALAALVLLMALAGLRRSRQAQR